MSMRYKVSLLALSLALAAVRAFPFAPPGSAAAAGPREVAKVEKIHGKAFAFVKPPHRTMPWSGRSLTRGDRLAEGERVEVEGRLFVLFDSGKRFMLIGGGLVQPRGLRPSWGRVLELPSFRLPPISREDNPGSAGGPRIRMGTIEDLYPRGGLSTLAGQTTLHFRADPANRYQVEVFNERGKTVFSREMTAGVVPISAKLLRPGKHYFWKVRSVGRPGPAEEGQADFITLPESAERERERLRRKWERDDELRPWLAVIDRELGLLAEAKAGLEEALARDPKEAGLREELAEVEAQLAAAGGV